MSALLLHTTEAILGDNLSQHQFKGTFALTAAPSYLLGGEHRGSSEAPLSPSAEPRSRRPSGSLLPPARESRNVLRLPRW